MDQSAAENGSTMFKCMETAKQLLGDKFSDCMRDYGNSVRKVSEAKNISILEAGKLLAEVSEAFPAMLVMAATASLMIIND